MKQNDNVEPKKDKNVAFKIENEDKDSQSEEDDFALLARRFRKFMKKGRFNQRRNFHKEKDQKETNPSNELRCFECKKLGHIRSDCPQLKRKDHKENKVKKKALAAWSEEELSSSEDSQDEEVANVCFMTKLDDKVTSKFSNSISEFTFEELHDAFNELLEEYEQMNLKNVDLKKKIWLLEGEVKISKSEKKCLENERNSVANEKESLLKENKDIKESLEKLVKGKKS